MKAINQVCIIALILIAAMLAHQVIEATTGGVNPVDPEVGRNFHVEIVTDSSKPLTQEQVDAISAGVAVNYMDSHCEKEADGHSGWRRIDASDADRQLANEAKIWRDLYAKHGDPPSVVIKSGPKIVTVPLPKDAIAFKTLLQQYGGK